MRARRRFRATADPVKIESSQLMPLDGAPVVKRFTQGSDGLLDLWSEERGSLIASNMVNSQSISDPLLDTGPGVPADLASYIGYMPLATVAAIWDQQLWVQLSYPGLSPYPGMMVSVFAPFPAAAFLYAPRRYTTVFSSRTTIGSRPIIGGGIGILSSPRTITMPRPIYGTRPGTPVVMPRVWRSDGCTSEWAPVTNAKSNTGIGLHFVDRARLNGKDTAARAYGETSAVRRPDWYESAR